jgi:pimeloyl-ACP methyl ester carboxylesterase
MKLILDKKESYIIGGIKQYLFIQSNLNDAPIILFLHGGPGTAQIQFARKLQKYLVNDFIVIDWDQRGSGRSYSSRIKKDSMKIEQFISDAEEIINVILNRFHKSKLILVGHSWGSILGFRLTRKIPEKIACYIGMGQIINMKEGELVSYEYTLSEAKKRNDTKAVNALLKIGKPPYRRVEDGGIQRDLLGKYHGITCDGSGIWKIFQYISLRDTNPFEFYKFVRGIILSLTSLEDELMLINFENESLPDAVPVYFICGSFDYNVPYELVERYVSKAHKTNIKIIKFEKSGHLPNFEEPELFAKTCRQIKDEIFI